MNSVSQMIEAQKQEIRDIILSTNSAQVQKDIKILENKVTNWRILADLIDLIGITLLMTTIIHFMLFSIYNPLQINFVLIGLALTGLLDMLIHRRLLFLINLVKELKEL